MHAAGEAPGARIPQLARLDQHGNVEMTCVSGQGGPDPTTMGVFPPQFGHRFRRNVPTRRADPNPGRLAGGTRSQPFFKAA